MPTPGQNVHSLLSTAGDINKAVTWRFIRAVQFQSISYILTSKTTSEVTKSVTWRVHFLKTRNNGILRPLNWSVNWKKKWRIEPVFCPECARNVLATRGGGYSRQFRIGVCRLFYRSASYKRPFKIALLNFITCILACSTVSTDHMFFVLPVEVDTAI